MLPSGSVGGISRPVADIMDLVVSPPGAMVVQDVARDGNCMIKVLQALRPTLSDDFIPLPSDASDDEVRWWLAQRCRDSDIRDWFAHA
jgi:hypothetical protein